MTFSLPDSRRAARWAGIVLLLLATTLFATTFDNGLESREFLGGDLITHQYAQVQARPGNAPGYPLYTMGGWLWFHAVRSLLTATKGAPPNPTPILSSYSALWAILAIALLYWILCHVTSSRYRAGARHGASGNWPVAWLICAYYAVTYHFWYYATTTEQYSSAIAQTLAIVAVYLLWQEADAAHGTGVYGVRSRPGGLLVFLAFLCGISLAHMLTVALIVPPLVGVILWQRPGLLRRPSILMAVILAAALPLVSYIFVYVRAAQHPEWRGRGEWASNLEWFVYFLSTPQGRDELREAFREHARFFANGFPQMLWQELNPLFFGAGLFGLAWLKRRTALFLYGTIALYLLFAWAYRYANWYQVVLPIYPLLLIGLAVAVTSLQSWPPLERRPALRFAVPALLALAVLWRLALSLPDANSRNREADVDLGRPAAMLLAAPPGASLFADVHDALALEYLRDIWGLRDDLQLVSSLHANDALEVGRPLLSTWEAAPTLFNEMRPSGRIYLRGLSPEWVQVAYTPFTPTLSSTLDVDLIPGVTLAGMEAAPAPASNPAGQQQPAIDLLLHWRLAAGRWPEGVSLSLRPLHRGEYLTTQSDADDGLVHVDTAWPLRGLLAWEPGEDFVDAYRVPLNQPLPDGADAVELLLYRSTETGFETLAQLILDLQNGGPESLTPVQ